MALVWPHKGPSWTWMSRVKRPFLGFWAYRHHSSPPGASSPILVFGGSHAPGSVIGSIAKCWAAFWTEILDDSLLPHIIHLQLWASSRYRGLISLKLITETQREWRWHRISCISRLKNCMGLCIASLEHACHRFRCKSIAEGTFET